MKIIFLHGLGQTAAVWKPTLQVMTSQTDCLCPNLPDWLINQTPSYETLYSSLEKYALQYDEPLNLCGLSLGGILALNFAIDHPNTVHSLSLIGTQYTMPKHLLQLQNVIFHLIPASKFQEMGFQKTAFIRLCKSMIDLDFTHHLHKITCPVLILCGARDRANKPSALQLKEQLPTAKLSIIRNAGHEVNIDAPAELGHIINDFLTSFNT
ncbi:hypothetical protein C804_01488 [Lachnospiraceae bacterium A4]|nr:hypothetical protein C804_01488 [Lachnospiraceae bacterium A4]